MSQNVKFRPVMIHCARIAGLLPCFPVAMFAFIPVAMFGCLVCSAQEGTSTKIPVQAAFLAVRDKAEIPALERGNLIRVTAKPGTKVVTGQELASLDDREATLLRDVALVDLQLAERKIIDSKSVEIAQASLTEAIKLLDEVREEVAVSQEMAADDTAILLAQKDEELAAEEFERAKRSREVSKISVSDQEWSNLKIGFEKKQILTRKARIEQTLAEIRVRSKQAALQQQETMVARLELALQEAKTTLEIQQQELETLRKAVEIAETRLERLRLRAPFNGVVVEQQKQAGEWAETGQTVVRMIGLDHLYVEGFVDSQSAHSFVTGAPVVVKTSVGRKDLEVAGTVVFISPEVDSNRQVLVRAEIPNPRQVLRPGERVEMWVETSGSP